MDCMLCSSKDVEEEKGCGERGEEVRSGMKFEGMADKQWSARKEPLALLQMQHATVDTRVSRGNGDQRHPGLACALFLI